MIRFLVVLSFLFPGSVLLADQVYRMELTVKAEKKEPVTETHTWYVSDKEFRLNIAGGGRIIDYIFTGHSLLSCLKIIDSQIIKTVSIHKDLEQAMTKGLCIVSPINVMSSFLISPLHSLSFVDTDDSMKSSLEIKSMSASTPKNKLVDGADCQEIKRQFTFVSGENKQRTIEGEINGCYASVNWRARLWREVSRRLLQQKEGRELRQKLQAENIDRLGIPIAGTVAIKQTTKGEKNANVVSESTVLIALKKHESVKMQKRHFQKPASYKMVSTFQSSDKVVASLKEEQGKAEDEFDLINLLKWFKPLGAVP